MAISHKLKINF